MGILDKVAKRQQPQGMSLQQFVNKDLHAAEDFKMQQDMSDISTMLDHGVDAVALASKYDGQLVTDVLKQKDYEATKLRASLPGGFQDGTHRLNK